MNGRRSTVNRHAPSPEPRAPTTDGRPPVRYWVGGVGAVLALAGPLAAQPNPRAAQPERPTVATHAGTVAPGFVELEAGFELDRLADRSTPVSLPALLKFGIGERLQLNLTLPLVAPPGTALGLGDAGAGLKIRLGKGFAVLPSIKFPTGSGSESRGTGTTDGALLLIWSRALGPVAMDLNAGATLRSGDETRAPRTATVWTASFGGPMEGPVGWVVEWFGYPATQGPAGSASIVALLAGPTLALKPWLVLDAGGILGVAGPQPDALYAGLTVNLGRYMP